jgi:hypothetical protein
MNTTTRRRLAAVALTTLASLGSVGLESTQAVITGDDVARCDSTWRHPHSATAQACRDHGWTVMRRLVVSPHGVIRHNRLTHCPEEDGSRVTPRCVWIGTEDGNGVGLSYWFGTHHASQPHYVWPVSPVRYNVGPRLHWVGHELADALAEGGSLHADTRHWEKCVVQYGPTTTVICPDGHREAS